MVKKTKNIIKNFENPDNEREYLLAALKIKQREKESLVKNNFLEFVKYMWPEFIEGYHHKVIAEKFNKDIRHYERNLLYFYVIQRLPKIILELASLLLIILLLLFYLSRSSDYAALFPQFALFAVLTVRFIPAFSTIVMSLNYIKIFDASINLIKRELNDMVKTTN